MNYDQPKPNLTDEQVAEVERRLKGVNPTFMTSDEVPARLDQEALKNVGTSEPLRKNGGRITPETPIESLYDEKTGLPK